MLRNAETGRNNPVTANTLKKKNNQRGPKVGSVDFKRYIKPNHPIVARIDAAGIVDFTEGDDIIFVFLLD